ncbi:NHL repeat-containing protein [Sphingobacterium faecale]|uniref:PQQ-binding-like beta-propeller repeat protein n=1 Tax=Sphingobacterium faecale TaxID=2803775 RepID=A0ABS1R4A5_9SPHI|nr:hypothetical protein [Sphingobacterium faecale]MBL1409074.1 hypothetical protein [Sphingobacterium faecale]
MLKNRIDKLIITILVVVCSTMESIGQFVHHGPQVFAAAIQGSHFLKDSKGKEYVFTVVRGVPARLVGYELEENRMIVNSLLPGTDGAWDMEVSSDNRVYISGNGKMYSYTLGDAEIKDLGVALPGQKVIWDLVAGKDGKIYGGTYPGGQVFEYDPKTGFKDVGNGALKAGEEYVRSIAYDAKNNRIYAGLGSHAAFIELDIASTNKKDLLATQDKDHEFVYDMEFVPGLKGGDRIFAWLNSAKGMETFIYNVSSGKYEQRLPSIEIKSMVRDEKTQKIYYTAANRLYVMDFSTTKPAAKEIAKIEGRGRAGWVDTDGNYKVLTSSHKVFTIDLKTGQVVREIMLDVPKAPISIQSIFWGPDDKVWSAGYLAGNHGTFDPKTGEHVDYPGLHQSEGMNSLGNVIYFGNYTKAEIYSYDVTRPWSTTNGNPKFLGAIKNQDRPFAVLPMPHRDEMLFGTITGYGQLGGAIAHLDVKTEQLESFANVIPNQAITSLIEFDGRVIGGSTIFGGLGAVPVENRGRIFEWDPEEKRIVWMDSIADYWSVSGLFIGPDKGLWGFADGALIKYDVKSRKVVFQREIYSYNGKPSHIWRNGLAVTHPNGLIYFTLSDKLYSYDVEKDELKALRDNASLMVLGKDNKIYFREGTDLWSYTP